MYRTGFYLVVGFHFCIVIINFLAFFIVPFTEKIWVAIPIMSFVLLITFSRDFRCPLTAMENYLRVQIGKPRIGGFIGHYIKRPIKKYYENYQRRYYSRG